MKDVLKQLILDFQGEGLPRHLFPRQIRVVKLRPAVRKAHVFIGVRRCGKTSAMYQYMKTLINQRVSIKHLIYINFEDDRLIGFNHRHFQYILDAVFELDPSMTNSKKLFFFFDEIQEVEGWEKFIRRLLDREKMQIFITGSSAKMLGKEIATELRGRTIIYEIFPLSFPEYLQHADVRTVSQLTSTAKARLTGYLDDYLKFGGFPEFHFYKDKNEFAHRQLLQGYVETVVYRDIVDRHGLSNHRIVKMFLISLIANSAAPASIQKIYRDYKSQGYRISKNSLYDFLRYYEDSFCIFSIPLFSHSIRKQNQNPKKVYPVDPGLITAYSIKPEFEFASRFETAVYLHLRRNVADIYYYKTASGKEVDFVTQTPEGEIQLFQACYSMKNPETVAREENALIEAMKELNVRNASIITFDDVGESVRGKVKISWAPFPVWMANLRR